MLCLTALNRLYRHEPAFYEVDFRAAGFEWLEVDNAAESIVAFQRRAADPRDAVIVVFNFSAVSRPAHRLGVPYPVRYEVLFDSNDAALGGFGAGRTGESLAPQRQWSHGWPVSLTLRLPALSGLVLKPAPPDSWPRPVLSGHS
jgi:1,4-alpha-glucan branching enzyme